MSIVIAELHLKKVEGLPQRSVLLCDVEDRQFYRIAYCPEEVPRKKKELLRHIKWKMPHVTVDPGEAQLSSASQ